MQMRNPKVINLKNINERNKFLKYIITYTIAYFQLLFQMHSFNIR